MGKEEEKEKKKKKMNIKYRNKSVEAILVNKKEVEIVVGTNLPV